MLGFNSSDDPDLARKFMEECGFTFRTVLDGSSEATHVAFQGYKASCVPLHYVIDREGKIALTQPGFEGGYKKILGTLSWLGVNTGVPPRPPDEPATETDEEEGPPATVGSPVRGKARIHGTVFGESGKPLQFVTIRLECSGPPVNKIAVTDEEGGFRFRRLPHGRYTLTLERIPGDESKHIQKEITIKDDGVKEVNFGKE